MTWANFDDGYADHPKIIGLSDGAFRLHASSVLYCSRYLTDGFIPKPQVSKLIPTFRAAYVNELIKSGLWVAEGGGYYVHDYLQWNRSKAEIEAVQAAKSKAGRKGAESRWQKRGR